MHLIGQGVVEEQLGGELVRSMQVSATYEGQTPTTSIRREVVTFNGSGAARVRITQDGNTETCSVSLPSRRLSCS